MVLWAQGIVAPPTNKQAPANQTVPDHPDNQEKPEVRWFIGLYLLLFKKKKKKNVSMKLNERWLFHQPAHCSSEMYEYI